MGWLNRVMSLALCTALVACGGNDDSSSGTATVRLINASAGYAALDFYIDGAQAGSEVAQGSAGSYGSANSSGSSIAIHSAGSSTALLSSTMSPAANSSTAVIAYGWQGALKTLTLNESITAPSTGSTKVLFIHTAVDAGTLDVYLTAPSDDLANATPLSASLAAASTAGHFTLTAGTYRLRVTRAGDKSDLRLDVDGIALADQGVAALILTPGSGGVLVHALLMLQQGSVTAFANTKARVRAVGSVAANARISLELGGQPLLANALSPSIGSYTLVPAGSPAPNLTIDGSAAPLAAQALQAGADYTLLLWGTAAAPQNTLIVDDNRLPSTSGQTKLRLVHGVSSLGAPLTLTADFAVTASDVAEGQASSFGAISASSSARLEVSSPLSIDPVYGIDSASLVANGLYTVFMLGDSSKPVGALRRER
jgi:hypothetical protein